MKSPYQLVQESYSDVSGFEIDHIAVETALSEADQLLEEISETAHYVEATESVESNLALIARYEETLAAAVESGEGIDKAGLDVVNMSVTSIMSQLGFPNEEVTACATESYGSPVSAAMEAMEGTKKNLSKAYAVVRATIKAIFNAIVKFFKTFGLNAKKLVDAAKSMLIELSNTKKQADKEKWIDAQKSSNFGKYEGTPDKLIKTGMNGLKNIETFGAQLSKVDKKSPLEYLRNIVLFTKDVEKYQFHGGKKLKQEIGKNGGSSIKVEQVEASTTPNTDLTKSNLISGLKVAAGLNPKEIVKLSDDADKAAKEMDKLLYTVKDDSASTAAAKSLATNYQMLSTFMLTATLAPVRDVIKLSKAYIAATK